MAEKPQKRSESADQLRLLVEIAKTEQRTAARSAVVMVLLTLMLVGLTAALVLLTLALALR